LIICDTTFEQAAKNINDDSVLRSLGNGEYLLNSDLQVEEGARLTIASPEVKWVKISNQGSLQYSIVVNGYMDIDGVKITSWTRKKIPWYTKILWGQFCGRTSVIRMPTAG
jgi:hypothetical protein